MATVDVTSRNSPRSNLPFRDAVSFSSPESTAPFAWRRRAAVAQVPGIGPRTALAIKDAVAAVSGHTGAQTVNTATGEILEETP